jgi:protein AroM
MSTALPTTRPRLGIVTIGQTPRPDLAAAFQREAPHAEVRVAGALDGVSPDELAALTAPGPYPLLVRLAGGTTVEVPRDRLVRRVAAAATTLAAGGVRLVVVACAGEFPAVPCPVPVLVPGRLVPVALAAQAPLGPIGVVTPNTAQVPWAAAKWRNDGFDPVVAAAAPGDAAALEGAAVTFARSRVSVVVLDCMGHGDAERAALATRSGRPVIAVQPLVARLAAAML